MEIQLDAVHSELPRMCCVCGQTPTARFPTRTAWTKLDVGRVLRRELAVELGACAAHAAEVERAATRIARRNAISRFLLAGTMLGGFPVVAALVMFNRPSFDYDPAVGQMVETPGFLPIDNLTVFGLYLAACVAAGVGTILLRRPVKKTLWFAGSFADPKVGFDGEEITMLLGG